jgi:hypothetical protein
MGSGNPFNHRTASVEQDPEVAEMRKNRRVNSKVAGLSKTAMTPGGGRGGSDLAFATGRPRDPFFYWKQNNLPYDTADTEELKRIRQFCNTPDAPVWMGDYSFKPIGEIQVGDEVIGWDYQTGPSGESRKRLRRTKVLATSRRQAPMIVKITMESGRVIRCTPDHSWANPYYSLNDPGQRGWSQPEYRHAKVGREMVRVIDPTEPLTDEKQRIIAAWLGGIYDGEGSGERIAQSETHNPDVRQRIIDSLEALGLPATAKPDVICITREGRKSGQGAAQDLVNFLNWTNPTRRVKAAIDARLLAQPTGGRDKVVSIEEEGAGEVVSMQTETGNYTAWGFASKNCRLLYQTHPIIGPAIDIFTKYPLQGAELSCKDEQITQFYDDLFMSEEGLNYPEFLLDYGREYWTVGEAWPFASFNEVLGIWESEELLNPDDIEVERSPFLKDPRFLIRLPKTIRDLISTRTPLFEYQKLMENYPELLNFGNDNDLMPVSNVLLRQYKFKADTFNKRGVPLLMRAMRSVVQEEMLNSAMDAIADRLYTPLILARLGASATDLGTSVPWIPTPDDLADFEEALDGALAADFRVIVHNFGVQMENVFGREAMPDLGPDFDRIESRILQSFGLSQTMLNGASSGETYAADALNRDLVSQLLTTFQNLVKSHTRQRMLVVAEAQEHYDYEVRGGKRYVKMEEILEVDEETGEQRIVEQPKLLVPDMHFKTMNLRDEEGERQFLEALRESGVPISIKTRMHNIPIDLKDEIETTSQEQVDIAVAEQETRREIYLALASKGLPIPADLIADFRAQAAQAQPPLGQDGAMSARAPMLGLDPTSDPANLAPTMQDMAEPEPGVPYPGMGAEPVDPSQSAGIPPFGQPNVPEESNEQRDGMPTAAALRRREREPMFKVARRVLADQEAFYIQGVKAEDLEIRVVGKRTVTNDEGESVVEDITEMPILRQRIAAGEIDPARVVPTTYRTPSHIGMRREAEVHPDKPMDDWFYEPIDAD